MGGIGMTAVTVPVALQVLDAMQQRLFAVALGLRTLQTRVGEQDLAVEIEQLEEEIDALIRTLRSEASSANVSD
jgi:SAM-dependent MidA family methyltransferase